MSFKSYINYITESIVDQYKAVRAAARPGDILMRQTHGTDWPQSMALHSYIDGRQPPTITSAPHDRNTLGVYQPGRQTAYTAVNPIIYPPSWEQKVNTNSHELAHAFQHAAQFRDNAIPSPDAAMKSSEPQFHQVDQSARTGISRSDKRKAKRNAEMRATGDSHSGPGSEAIKYMNKHQYMNSDIEVNARAIGHAAENLDIRSDLDKPDTSAHMRALAIELARHHTDHFYTRDRPSSDPRSTDKSSTRKAVQSAIEKLRETSIARFRKNEESFHASAIMQPRSLKKGLKQYSRLIQHHEEELPADIHTPEGRDAFIRTHGARGDIAMMDEMNKRYAPK